MRVRKNYPFKNVAVKVNKCDLRSSLYYREYLRKELNVQNLFSLFLAVKIQSSKVKRRLLFALSVYVYVQACIIQPTVPENI